jgi:hypothetical protein
MPNNLKIIKKSVAADSKRILYVSRMSDRPQTSTMFQISGKTAGQEDVRAGVAISAADSVDIAIQILRNLRPDVLRPEFVEPKFSETPVGTYLRNSKTGTIVKVVERDERFDGFPVDDTMVAAEKIDGSISVPVQDSGFTDIKWEVVNVATSWVVVE